MWSVTAGAIVVLIASTYLLSPLPSNIRHAQQKSTFIWSNITVIVFSYGHPSIPLDFKYSGRISPTVHRLQL